MATTLSIKQQCIMKFIRKFLDENSFPPTVRDIVHGCKISSTSVADYNMRILEREGYIRRRPDISRGIELTEDVQSSKNRVFVPIVGQIAAGEPIPVPAPDAWDVTASADTIEVTKDLTGGREGIYALKVKGQSMIDAFINDGDTVLMQHTNTVENGQMAAVWLKSEKRATLKKVYVEKTQVRLQPANSRMAPIYTGKKDVEIQGKVIAVIRKLD